MASGSSFKSLDDLCQGLKRLDKLHGLLYGRTAISSKTPAKTPPPVPEKQAPVSFVTAAQDKDDGFS